MAKTAREQLESHNCYERAKTLEYWQTVPYPHKVAHAKKLIYDFYNHEEVKGMTCISVGGLDSITLLCLIRSMGFTAEQIPAVSVSVLEDKSIQKVHKALGVGFYRIRLKRMQRSGMQCSPEKPENSADTRKTAE